MKKIGGLIALAMTVTVGGVYATWTYSSTTEDIVDGYKEMLVTIDKAVVDGARGEYSIETNISGFTVGQAGTNSDGHHFHKAMLSITTSDKEAPYATIIFKPSVSADPSTKANGVASTYWFAPSGEMKYTMDEYGNYSATGTATDIFSFSPSATAKGDVRWTKEGTEETGYIFKMTLDQAALEAAIQINDFILDTKEEHDYFNTAMNKNIVLHVSDGVTPSTLDE